MGNCWSSASGLEETHHQNNTDETETSAQGDSSKPHIPGYEPPAMNRTSSHTSETAQAEPRERQFVTITPKGELILPDPNPSKSPTPFRFASLNAPSLIASSSWEQPTQFEQLDTLRTLLGFGRPVTRCYTLTVKSRNRDTAHVIGWDWDNYVWKLDEEHWKRTDYALAGAAKYDARIIFPIVNQDFGSEDTNWVGNQRDLIKMRKGVDKWEGVDFWRDREMIDAFKQLVTQLMNRVNHITKIRYGDDPSILAWETGNEMNAFQRPAPASWTLEIARHIKSLAPRTLIMDGSFARNDDPQCCYEKEVLQSKEVSLFSYHYYGSGDIKRVKQDIQTVKKYGKGFIAGEYGFFSKVDDYTKFLSNVESAGGQGSLAWSLRPHSEKGGFKTHGEGNGIYSYHVPGWPPSNPPSEEFDHREKPIVAAIRKASFKIIGTAVPPHPTPNAAELFLLPAPNWNPNAKLLSWKGSTWATTYELWINVKPDGDSKSWQLMDTGLRDAVKGGNLALELAGACAYKGYPVHPGSKVSFMLRAVGEDGHVGTYSNVLTVTM